MRGNVITGHGAAGIELREPIVQSGDRVWIEGNRIANNCKGDTPEPRDLEIVVGHNRTLTKLRWCVRKKAEKPTIVQCIRDGNTGGVLLARRIMSNFPRKREIPG